MAQVVNFNMVVEINKLLKEKNIEYSIHALGGCTCAGLQLRQDGKEYPIDEIVDVINGYLERKWMRVKQDENDAFVFNVESKFHFEKEREE